LEEFKKKNISYKDIKMSYAGRLDPMARGLLIALTGEQVKLQKNHETLSKEYYFQVLFGVETDTYDLLGLFKDTDFHNIPQMPSKIMDFIQNEIPSLIGKKRQPYPPYSSARIRGKPLFQWAKDGKLNSIEIPCIDVEIFELELLYETKISTEALHCIVEERVGRISSGDFRQKEILQRWKSVLSDPLNKEKELSLVQMRAKVGSGTYIRAIANSLGERLHIGAIAWDIYRTRVGHYCVVDSNDFSKFEEEPTFEFLQLNNFSSQK